MRIVISLVLGLSVFVISNSTELSKTMPLQNYRIITDIGQSPESKAYPHVPGLITQSPGLEIGTTYLDCQTIGSTGNRAVVCDDGSRYFCWTNLLGWPYPPAPRGAYFCWISPDGGDTISGPIDMDGSARPQLDDIYSGNAVFVYWKTQTNVTLALDGSYYDPPGQYWPYIAVDQNENIHLLTHQFTGQYSIDLAYTRSTDGGNTWTELESIEDVMVVGAVIDASPVSDRVAVVFPQPSDTNSQWLNDVVYVVSEDGLIWDFENNRINTTDYADDDDSLWAYTDYDIIFDYDDFIHIMWNAQWVTEENVYYRTFLFHYNEQTGQIDTVTSHPDSLWRHISGVWNRPICKMNMGVQESSNNLYAIWSQFDTSDVSAGGYGNGEVYMSYTTDGSLWEEPVNLTNSPTPGCYPGECDSDHWATLADKVDDVLHITYIWDKDAGDILQYEGSAVMNSVMYYEYPLETGIETEPARPEYFSNVRIYPNPFNAAANIAFRLPEQAFVTVKIYDITGAEVAVLLSEIKQAGNHEIKWDASEFSSGVYFVNLEANDVNVTRKMDLVK